MKTKLRASKISIETPKTGAIPWIHITVQQVLEDDNGKIVNVIPRYDFISKQLSEIYTSVYTYIDPVTTNTGCISGAGVASAITAIVIAALTEKYGGTVDENGDLIV